MQSIIFQLLLAGGIMGVLDYLWLGTLARQFYRNEIGQLLLAKPNMFAALIFYVIYIVGVVAFVISPAIEKGDIGYAIIRGAFLGFFAYATYDLTNLATLKGFSVKVVVVDLLWGAALTATVAGLTTWILLRG